MTRRMKRMAAAATVLALLGIIATAVVSSSSATARASMSRTYSLGECATGATAPCWTCNSLVNFDSVDIVVDQNSFPIEAVRLAAGCTGYIGTLNVVTQAGDGVKVMNGAHDIVIGGGSISCGLPTGLNNANTDQYGLRFFGGKRITVSGMFIKCNAKTASGQQASRGALFVNQVPTTNSGAPLANQPAHIEFTEGCLSSAPNTITLGDSDWAGVAMTKIYDFQPGPGNGPTRYFRPANPSGNPGFPATNYLDYDNDVSSGQGSCTSASG
jgi:hypothetical protein